MVRHRLVNVRGTQRTVAMPRHADVVDPRTLTTIQISRSVTVAERAEHLSVHRYNERGTQRTVAVPQHVDVVDTSPPDYTYANTAA